MIYRLVYVSSAAQTFTETELLELLAISRRNNAASDITGVLLHGSGSFIQVLEGHEAAVEKLYTHISQDTRHKGVIRLITEKSEARVFPDWSMGFKRMQPSDLLTTPEGFSKMLEVDETAGLESLRGRVRSLIQTFRQTINV